MKTSDKEGPERWTRDEPAMVTVGVEDVSRWSVWVTLGETSPTTERAVTKTSMDTEPKGKTERGMITEVALVGLIASK